MTLKIAHLADIHIGMENYGRLNPSSGLNQRLHDFLNSLDQALDAALTAGVDLVVFAGDIYKTRDPTPTHQREFAKRIHRLSAAGVPVFIAAGNHDIPLSPGRATSVDIFRELAVPNVTVARTIGTHRIETRGGPVQIVAFPWSVRSQLQVLSDQKNKTIAELNQEMLDITRGSLRQQAEKLDPELPSLVVGHAHLFGARVGAERLLTMGADPMYDLQTFDLPNVDYVALGHIHKHQALAYGQPPVVYAGSIDRVDFGEEQEDKGWVEVTLPAKGNAEWQFHKVQARPFVTIEARVESENATEDVVKAVARAGERIRDAVVRLRIEITPERLPELRDDEIRAQLKAAYYVAPVERVVQQRVRERFVGGDGGVAIQHALPLEALAYYLEHQRVEPEHRETLLRYARGLMGAEEHAPGTLPAEAHEHEPIPLPVPVAQSDAAEAGPRA